DLLCEQRDEGESKAIQELKTKFLVQIYGVINDHMEFLRRLSWQLDSTIR
ncbi:13232_t:CDS:1, partial [Funneliformis mosseae]